MIRRYISTALPLTAVFLLAELFAAFCLPEHSQAIAQDGEQLVPEPGVVSYSFRHQFQEDVPGTLDLIRGMGITNIEFSSLFGKSATELRELLDRRGMRCTSYGVGYNALMNDTQRIIEEAHILGASHVRVGSIPHDAPFTVEDAQRAADDFNRIGRILRENGLEFAYHNHGFEFRPYGDGTLFDYLVQNTDPGFVNYEMDTFWVAHPGHDPVELLKKYPDRFRLMHLKDIKHGAEHNYSGRAPAGYDVRLGTGQIDFPALLRAAQDSNIEYFYIEDESEEVVERVPKSLEYLRGLTE